MYSGDDLFYAFQYLRKAVGRVEFWKGIAFNHKLDATQALNELDDSPEALAQWVKTWLTEEQTEKMRSAVRKKRQRKKGKTVTLTDQAHRMLCDLSENGRLTLSEVIETRLARAHSAWLKKQ